LRAILLKHPRRLPKPSTDSGKPSANPNAEGK
jgi:hypothetical protein